MERIEADCSTGQTRVVKLSKAEADAVKARPADAPSIDEGAPTIDLADMLRRLEALEAKWQ